MSLTENDRLILRVQQCLGQEQERVADALLKNRATLHLLMGLTKFGGDSKVKAAALREMLDIPGGACVVLQLMTWGMAPVMKIILGRLEPDKSSGSET